ncbi:MAG: hypothetical protein NC310_03940 [Roseburia sp.]|nr:hypothetical protein [Anaeroplasma bactoclasticum]MCM1196211.1 hypothetical protein [Roseburia sp.]MCM1556022.1 hypothetical protein [Anaeroplasma bactoclasticum]
MKEEIKQKKQSKLKKIISSIPDNIKVGFFRWWFVGAIYFLVAWGTGLGNRDDLFDLIFWLAVAISFGHILIFNPIVFGMFEIERNGVIVNKKYNERKIWEGAIMKIFEFFHCFIVSILVFITYEMLNRWIIQLAHLNANVVPIQGEPFIYATLFLIYYNAISFIINKCILLFFYIKEKKLKKRTKES